MDDVTIWHNPRCSKSRATLALIEARGIAPRVRLYLQEPPDAAELAEVLRRLRVAAPGLIRKGEPEYRALGLSGQSDDATLIAAMAAQPKLIERPVVIVGRRAALGRPPEAVAEILPA
ncbi:MAG: arsenate reductase (glutaredoxin) [Thermohalobaculum sp.]|nr:arsenate reductase (glutaredoxin) [Thermohalobaculum sp.]